MMAVWRRHSNHRQIISSVSVRPIDYRQAPSLFRQLKINQASIGMAPLYGFRQFASSGRLSRIV
jgi:hypothetical protein